jgi:UDP-N-acetylmuramoylalanine-D-glutamate ligase
MALKKIAVLGLGKVGTLAARLLHLGGFEVTGFDSRAAHPSLPFTVRAVDVVAVHASSKEGPPDTKRINPTC